MNDLAIMIFLIGRMQIAQLIEVTEVILEGMFIDSNEIHNTSKGEFSSGLAAMNSFTFH